MPSMGFGVGQDSGIYREKKEKTESAPWIGERYHLAKIEGCRVARAEIDVDYWKAWVHARLDTPLDQPGAMTLFQPMAGPNEHLGYAKHLTAEKQVIENVAGRGEVRRGS